MMFIKLNWLAFPRAIEIYTKFANPVFFGFPTKLGNFTDFKMPFLAVVLEIILF